MSETRDKLLQYLVYGHGFVLEHPFRGLSGKRRFRFDAALPERMIALDYQGYGEGAAHTYRMKKAGDHEKLTEAQLCGWTLLVCDAVSVNNGKCFEYVDAALRGESDTL